MSGNPNFRLKPVAELLDGKHHFFIPSYQRGYRWEKEQVEDLLQDIYDFAKDATSKDFYCLQPIVVKPHQNGSDWIVIDGQQRLTTLLILIDYLRSRGKLPGDDYTIRYETRGDKLDLSNIDATADIDSYYISQTREIIRNWFEGDDWHPYSKVQDVIMYPAPKTGSIAQVCVIWYVAQDNDKTDISRDIASIKTFNNLNKGKIKLTDAELIKALFVLNFEEGSRQRETFAYQWNEVENALQDKEFWAFLSNREYDTRIEIIFDFLTGEEPGARRSYRRFQELHDDPESSFWQVKEIRNFEEAWQKIFQTYLTFRYWYSDIRLYNYIGYLVCNNVTLTRIFARCQDVNKEAIIPEMQKLIREEIKLQTDDVSELQYGNDKCKAVLLLFNVAVYDKAGLRFPFRSYKEENWDIEHVDSATTNKLTDIGDKIKWLEYMDAIPHTHGDWKTLKEQALALRLRLEEDKKESKSNKDEFTALHARILRQADEDYTSRETITGDGSERPEADTEADKNTIGNLTLLDSKTNRSYGNALFPTKQLEIIKNDKSGKFVPLCTKNLFLKYYSAVADTSARWKNSWTEDDKKAYLAEMINTLKPILK